MKILEQILYYLSRADILASKYDINGNLTKHYLEGHHNNSCQRCGTPFLKTIGKKGHNIKPIKWCSSQCKNENDNMNVAERRKKNPSYGHVKTKTK